MPKARRKSIHCEHGAACRLPPSCLGIYIRLRGTENDAICKGKYRLSDDKKSVIVNGTCKADFIVTFIKGFVLLKIPLTNLGARYHNARCHFKDKHTFTLLPF